MNPIKSFQITGMTLSGFKCFAEPTELTFGNPTVITGGNGRGKSTVADAIAFAITGLPFFGERGIDRLHAEDNPDLFLSMRFTDESGAAHELTRARQKSRMTITYDGREIRQSDLTDLFGEKDVFLSIFNPLYFIEELGDDGKKLLERYLPEIPREEVFALLSPSVQETLSGETILSPESYLKKKREEIREFEKSVIYLTGQKDLSEGQRRDAEEKRTALNETLRTLQAEYTELDEHRCAGSDVSEIQEQLMELSARYEELAREAPAAADTSEVDAQLTSLHQKLGERGAERYAPKYAQPIADAKAKVNALAQRYKQESATLKSFSVGTVCPTCRRVVTEAELPIVTEALQKVISEIVVCGKDAKGQLDELTTLEQKTADTFAQFQAEDMLKLETEIRLLTEKRAMLAEQAASANAKRQTELDTLLSQIHYLAADAECGALTQEEYDRMIACKSEIERVSSELAAAQKAAGQAPEDYDGKISAIEKEIEKRKKLITAVALYVSKRAELLFSRLKLNRVQISLFDVVKSTGEVKDALKFTYNGRRYDRLSLSEKVRAGMEVSELMKQLTGRNYPQYVDNMESIDDLANVRPTGQVIMAKCVKGGEFSMRVPEQVQSMPKAA
jgi:DNA repair exonuclease SbcCD ATPase subunit